MAQETEVIEITIRTIDADEIAKLSNLSGIGFNAYIREIIEAYVAEKGGRLGQPKMEEGRRSKGPLQDAREQKARGGDRLFTRRDEPPRLSVLRVGSHGTADVRDRLDRPTRGPLHRGRNRENQTS